MKPFNLKEHLEHPDWKVVTREGEPVRILCADLDDEEYPVAAAKKNRYVDRCTADGLFQVGKETKYDLFFAPEKHEGWINIFGGSNSYAGNDIFKSKEDAEKYGKKYHDYITTAKIEWEEEQ